MSIIKTFSLEENQLLLEFIEVCHQVKNEKQYLALLHGKLKEIIPFEKTAHILVSPTLRGPETDFYLGSFNRTWIDVFRTPPKDKTFPVNPLFMEWNTTLELKEFFPKPPPEEKRKNGIIISRLSKHPLPKISLFGLTLKGGRVKQKYKRLLELLSPHLHQVFLQVEAVTNQGVLSKKQKKVLSLIAKGLKRDEIAEKLGVKRITIDFHMENVMKQLGALNAPNAVKQAITFGLSLEDE